MRNKVLLIAGAISMIAAIFITIKQANKKDEDESNENVEDDKVAKVAKKVYKYWPTVLLCGISLTCFILVHRFDVRKTAAVIASYKVTSTAYNKHKKKTKEIVGESVEERIEREAKKEIVREVYETFDKNKIVDTGIGESLFYEPISKTMFKSSYTFMADVEKKLQDLSKEEFCIPLNTFYKLIKLKSTDDGKELGWNTMYNEIKFKYFAGAQIDGEVCTLISFECSPSYDYMELD